MDLPIQEAEGQLTELVRRAEAGEEIVLTRHGQPAVLLTPLTPKQSPEERERIIREVMEEGAKNALPGPCAARSQDFLYDEDGLPA